MPLASIIIVNKSEMAASIRAYFKGRPLLANCVTYGSLYMGAEFSQQTLLRKVLVRFLGHFFITDYVAIDCLMLVLAT